MGIGKFFQVFGVIFFVFTYASEWNSQHGFPYPWLGQKAVDVSSIELSLTYITFFLVSIGIILIGFVIDKWKVK